MFQLNLENGKRSNNFTLSNVIIKSNNKMKLKRKILNDINKPATRIQLALALDCTEQTIIRKISLNDDDLTKASALKVIREATGLTDSEILEEVPNEVQN